MLTFVVREWGQLHVSKILGWRETEGYGHLGNIMILDCECYCHLRHKQWPDNF